MERLYNNINNGMCRCCASEGTFKDLSSKYRWMGVEEVYADMLRECFDVTLTYPEENPEAGICEVCITQLRNAANFKKQVLNTEEQFKKMLQNKTNIVKVEVSPPEDDGVQFTDEDNNLSNDDFSSTEYEVPIKTESEEGKSRKRSAKAGPSRSKQPKMEGESSAKRLPQNVTPHNELKKLRANLKMILQYSNATPIHRHGAFGYACCFCSEQYLDAADLKKHTIQDHDEKTKLEYMNGKPMYIFLVKLDITALLCNICNDSIDSLEALVKHLIEVHDKLLYTDVKNHILPFKFEKSGDITELRCVVCSQMFDQFKNVFEHMSTHYRNFVCDICDAGFITRCNLAEHSGIHKSGVFNCNFCEKSFDTLRKQKAHQNCIHNDHISKIHGVQILALKCEACERTFPNQLSLRTHMKRDHVKERRYECTECNMKFFRTYHLQQHIVKHTGAKDHKCEICLKEFSRKKALNEHMKKLHMQEKQRKSVSN